MLSGGLLYGTAAAALIHRAQPEDALTYALIIRLI